MQIYKKKCRSSYRKQDGPARQTNDSKTIKVRLVQLKFTTITEHLPLECLDYNVQSMMR